VLTDSWHGLPKRVSSLGALYDLASDFVGSMLIFIAIGTVLAMEFPSSSLEIWGLTLVAALSYFLTCTAASYTRWRHEQINVLPKNKSIQLFLSYPLNDGKTHHYY